MVGTERTSPSQSKAWRHLLAVIIGVLPLYVYMICYHLWSSEPITARSLIIYLSLISPLAIVIALLVLRVLCRENLHNLNLKPGRLFSDSLATVTLCIITFIVNLISSWFLSQLFPDSAANPSVRSLFTELAGNLWLLILFLGLLIPLGAASEEVIRVILLSRLWKVWPSTAAKLITVVISAALFGLIHFYRGPSGIVSTGIFGLIMALYYLRFGRFVPLILTHYLTNALQVMLFVASAP